MNPQIVILSDRDDEHAIAVLSTLSANVRPFLLDIGKTGVDFVVTRSTDGVLGIVTRGGNRITFEETAFWWVRRPRVRGLEGAPHFLGVKEAELALFWNGVFGLGLTGTWCNPFRAHVVASNKIRQLHVAKAMGMRCPDTIWTNSRDDVEAFIEKHKGSVVFKMFAGTDERWQPCRKFDSTFAAHIEHVRFMPAIYQEYLPGAGEYRVTIFGSHCFAARADMGLSRFPSDVRIDLALKRTVSALPSEMEYKLRAFMRELGLLYATFDIREDAKGDLVFLECNPMGEFLYLDGVCGGAMLKAFCRFIEDHIKGESDFRTTTPEQPSATAINFTTDIRVPIYERASSWVTAIPAS